MTTKPPLFPDEPTLPANPSGAGPARTVLPKASARVLMPNRNPLELRASDLESLLPPGHRARIVWGYVERQDLTRYAGIKAVEGGVGRAAIAPEILFALWLYATVEGVGSARTIPRLTQAHDAYRWIGGGVQVNYHTVADFRSCQGDALGERLTEHVATLMAAGVVKWLWWINGDPICLQSAWTTRIESAEPSVILPFPASKSLGWRIMAESTYHVRKRNGSRKPSMVRASRCYRSPHTSPALPFSFPNTIAIRKIN